MMLKAEVERGEGEEEATWAHEIALGSAPPVFLAGEGKGCALEHNSSHDKPKSQGRKKRLDTSQAA